MVQIDQRALEAQLQTRLLGRPLIYLPSVESTQDMVREAARGGAREGLAVIAGQQTKGRGRAGRRWWSPPQGGLYLSLLLRPHSLQHHTLAWLTMALSLGAAEAIEQVADLAVPIKWPNDLEWQGHKLAGVLAEGAFSGEQLDYVVVGIGLNLDVDFSAQPDLAAAAVSLTALADGPVPATALVAALLYHTEQHYLAACAGHSPTPAWSARLVTLGRAVTARTPDGRAYHGIARQVMPDGALQLDLDAGGSVVVRADDVTLRAAPAL